MPLQPSTKIDVQATVKERGNDRVPARAPNDPNCDTHLTHVVNTYEPEQNAAYTFALNGKQFYLETNDKHSAFGFKSDNATPFQSLFVVDLSGCDAGAPATCFERTLNTSTDPPTTGYNDGPVLYFARLTDTASGVNANNVVAIHNYDNGIDGRPSATRAPSGRTRAARSPSRTRSRAEHLREEGSGGADPRSLALGHGQRPHRATAKA